MSDIELCSEMGVSLIDSMGTDESVVHAARVSIVGARAETEQGERKGLLNFLMKNRHASPFEHVTATFMLEVPIFVTREVHRHRTFCLPAGTKIYQGKSASYQWKLIEEMWDNWHNGVPDTMGRRRKLPSVYAAPYRTLNEDTLEYELATIKDIWKTGLKDIVKVTAGGRTIRCSTDHLIFTPNGYVKACELSIGDLVGTMGRLMRPHDEGPRIIPSLRKGINEWTQQQRSILISNQDQCVECEEWFPREQLRLDHKTPIVLDISKALSIDNLQILCQWCHRPKTASESKYANRPTMVAGCQWQEVSEIVNDGTEDCYDIEMNGPWNNFIADGFVVHNSYNEVSGRYSVLPQKFYMPSEDRPLVQIGKPGAYSFEKGTILDYQTVMVCLHGAYQEASLQYEMMLNMGIAKEVARDCLPVAVYTAFYMTGSLRNWFNFLSLRTSQDALYEIRETANKVEELLHAIAPVSMGLWVENNRQPL